MRDQVVPATANIESADIEFPDIALNTTSPRAWGIDSTLNLSLGFGGANACAILTRPASMARNPQVQRNGSLDEVVVTGSGVIFPGVTGSTQLARHLADAEPEETPVSGSVPEDQYSHLVSARRVRRMSDYVKLTLGATALAFADAQIDDVPAFGEDCSAVLGTTHGSTTYCETYYSQIVRDGLGAANPMLFAEGVPNAAVAQLSMMFQVKGLCQTVIGTRTAGLDALWLAALRIASGQWRRAVVCAGEEFSPVIARAYERHGLYSSAGLGAPFSTQTGFVGTAGAATLILESRAAAESRGARCLGRVLAGHSSSTEHLASRNGVEGIRRCLGSVGNSTNVLSSSNGTWIDRVEALGIASSRRGRGSAVVSSLYAHIAESFSVGSLAGIAGILAVPGSGEAPKSRAFPALRSPWGGYRGLALPSVPGTRVSDFTALCCDYAGIVSAVGIQCF
jgi:3-oxoacyl-(acyl-carrier-protein) synthase